MNRCDIAEQVDKDNGLVPDYTTTPCNDDLKSPEAIKQIESVMISIKMINQEFDPEHFFEKNETLYRVE